MLRYTLLGKRMRALVGQLRPRRDVRASTPRGSSSTPGSSPAALAGLAGVLAGASPTLQPELGFELLLPIFAAVVLGGIGNAFGALAGGIVLGLVTGVVDAGRSTPRWKVAVGFLVLILVLLVRPQGIFGKARTADD